MFELHHHGFGDRRHLNFLMTVAVIHYFYLNFLIEISTFVVFFPMVESFSSSDTYLNTDIKFKWQILPNDVV